MQLFDMVFLITLHITSSPGKRRHRYSLVDGESIENILYYQDVKQNKPKSLPPTEKTPQKPTCCPKMCCTSCCGDCQSNNPVIMQQFPQSYFDTKRSDTQPGQFPQSFNTKRSDTQPGHMSQSSFDTPNNLWPPSYQNYYENLKNQTLYGLRSGRREFGDTKENIKGLISQDEDIKRILKDLVRVTMQKVTLVEQLKEKRANRRMMETTEGKDVGGSGKDDKGDDEYEDDNNGDENELKVDD